MVASHGEATDGARSRLDQAGRTAPDDDRVWLGRADRYSQLRTARTRDTREEGRDELTADDPRAHRPRRVEMSYIGG